MKRGTRWRPWPGRAKQLCSLRTMKSERYIPLPDQAVWSTITPTIQSLRFILLIFTVPSIFILPS